MGKRKIYWWIQQIDDLGGAEMVSIDIANHLANDFDITLLVSSEIKNDVTYTIDPQIKIISLGFKKEFVRLDQYLGFYKQKHQYGKMLKLVCHTFNMLTFKRNKIRHQVEQYLLQDNNAILIASSLDNYLFAPKHGKTYYHFHFDAKNFLSLFNQGPMLLSRKPDKFIFLSESIRQEVIKHKKKLKNRSLAINNPSRFAPKYNATYNNNSIIFVGRYAKQKNPMLALKIAYELKNRGFNFHLNMYGTGPLEKKMKKYILKNDLSNLISVNPPSTNMEKIYSNADLLLMTSLYEGFVLVKIEGNSFSVPAVLKNWGPSINDVASSSESIIVDGDNPKHYADAIMQILSEENLAIYRKNAFQFSHRFTHENVIKQWEKLFNE